MISGPMPSPRITAMVWVILYCSNGNPAVPEGPILCPRRFRRRPGADLQGVDVGLHHVAERGIDTTVACQRRQPGEVLADDVHGKMPSAVARAFMADVAMAVVADLQCPGVQGQQRGAHACDALRIVG